MEFDRGDLGSGDQALDAVDLDIRLSARLILFSYEPRAGLL
jgi:hypothetical protein